MIPAWDSLGNELLALHATTPALRDFCTLPDPLPSHPVTPWLSRAAPLMGASPGETTPRRRPLRDALVAATRHMRWRETYEGSALGDAFVSKFAVFQVIGPSDAPFHCDTLRSFIAWTPPGLHYPWHHHPAEELYVVIAGEAEFFLHGEPPRILRPGDSIFHPSMRPHAVTNHAHPVLSYIVWRGDLDTLPAVTPPEHLR